MKDKNQKIKIIEINYKIRFINVNNKKITNKNCKI